MWRSAPSNPHPKHSCTSQKGQTWRCAWHKTWCARYARPSIHAPSLALDCLVGMRLLSCHFSLLAVHHGGCAIRWTDVTPCRALHAVLPTTPGRGPPACTSSRDRNRPNQLFVGCSRPVGRIESTGAGPPLSDRRRTEKALQKREAEIKAHKVELAAMMKAMLAAPDSMDPVPVVKRPAGRRLNAEPSKELVQKIQNNGAHSNGALGCRMSHCSNAVRCIALEVWRLLTQGFASSKQHSSGLSKRKCAASEMRGRLIELVALHCTAGSRRSEPASYVQLHTACSRQV